MKFLSLVLITAILAGTIGCSVSEFDTVVSVAAPALVNVLNIVAIAEGKPVNTGLIQKINLDAKDVKQAGDDIVGAVAGATGGCQKFEAALGAFQGDLALVEQAAQVSDSNTQIEISSIVALVVSTVDGITAVLPQCNAQTSDLVYRDKLAVGIEEFTGSGATVSKATVSKADFLAKYNAALLPKHQKYALHAHSKPVRVLGKIGKAGISGAIFTLLLGSKALV